MTSDCFSMRVRIIRANGAKGEDAPSRFTGLTDGRLSLLTSGRTSSEMTEEDIARVSTRPALRAGDASTSSAAQKTSER